MSKLPFKTWQYEEQTHMKHNVFQDYFDKWVKILGSCHSLNYIDGFAGCGAYDDPKTGKTYFGSPVLASKIIRDNNKETDTSLMFIDTKKGNLENLQKILEFQKLSNLKIHYIHEKFDNTINSLLDAGPNLAPTFFFIDPFGYTISYSTLQRIMNMDRSEIFLNFMFNSINRFMSLDKVDSVMTTLFGSDEWKSLTNLSGDEREEKIVALYKKQLKKIARFVYQYKFQFPDKKRTYYYMFHLTNHWKGCSIMKSSFAKYAHGRTEWLGADSGQLKLTEMGDAKIAGVNDYLTGRYNGQNLTYLDIIEQNIDSTLYLDSDFSHSIKDLEKKELVYIERYPKQTEKRRQLRKSIEENDNIYFGSFPGITRKSLLYETKVEYGDYTINHVLGCAHGCTYPCYAMGMALRYGRVHSYDDWIHPKLVINALELLEKEIPKYKDKIDFVHLCFTTDPFMYDQINGRVYPQIKELTLQIIKKLNESNIRCTVLTKGLCPKELTSNGYSKDNEYGITLVSLDERFKKEFEPYSASFEERIAALKFLHDRGLKTWVSIEPYPTPNIIKQDLTKLLEKIAFVDKVVFGKMNYNTVSNQFEKNDEFYTACSQTVIAFCDKRKIRYYIKEGTPNNGSKTEGIFDEEG